MQKKKKKVSDLTNIVVQLRNVDILDPNRSSEVGEGYFEDELIMVFVSRLCLGYDRKRSPLGEMGWGSEPDRRVCYKVMVAWGESFVKVLF